MRFACRRSRHTPRGSRACVGNGVILSPLKEKVKRKPSPHKMRDFLCFDGGDRAEEVPCGSRVGGADIRRGAPALAWETALSCLLNLSKAQCLPFNVFLEETGFLEPARFACLRAVYSPKKYAEGPALAWETALSCPIVTKKLCCISLSPHFMRDFLCFSGENRDEEVPCGSRA